MKICYSRKEPMGYTDEYGSKKTRPGGIVINKLDFCCEEMADEIMQKPCSLSNSNPCEVWFCRENDLEYCARFCPFCGEKIVAVDITINSGDYITQG